MESKSTSKTRGRKPYKSGQINEETKGLLIKTARDLFAKCGYDGTSVADIANEAGVNKALVFYYFKNKEGVLQEVLNVAAKDAVDRREIFLRSKEPFSRESMNMYYKESLRHMESKKEVIKILLTEALKNNNSSEYLFDFLENALGEVSERLRQIGFQVIDEQKLQTSEFFFDAMALFVFVALEEKWSSYKGFEREKVKKDFLDVFNESYLDYIFKKYSKN